ncbi:hypothetical protein GCM10023322_77300 [Rugosimonospora acidiphila]|uniref:Aminoglycoside phosphotransferase domain-containing protein n=1 Tax=Rugosimonospora acidiphila TaxID=556531 RepID=A0ABP9SRU8_9ACTN
MTPVPPTTEALRELVAEQFGTARRPVALDRLTGGSKKDVYRLTLDDDPRAAAAPLSALGDSLRRMHTTIGPGYGKLTLLASGRAPQTRRPEEIIVGRAMGRLDEVARRDARIAAVRHRIARHVRDLAAAVTPRATHGLVHGELGPDHVLVTPAGEPVIIDIEGLTYFDVEWEHAFLRMRFGDAYPALRPVEVTPTGWSSTGTRRSCR